MRGIPSAIVAVALVSACQKDPPAGADYFDRVILPILNNSCSTGTSGCHKADPGDPYAFAVGNLDTSSFENIKKRPDVLRQYGAYPIPLLLLKALGPTTVFNISYRGQLLPMEIPHAGGSILRDGSPAFLTLQQWLANGATRDGQRPTPGPVQGEGPCTDATPEGFDESTVTSTPEWAAASGMFDAVQNILVSKGCNAGNCHGAPQSDFFLTCGTDSRQKAFNFRQVRAFSADPARPEDAEILNFPVTGVTSHTGGAHIEPGDGDYATLEAFVVAVGKIPFPETADANRSFFADEVMPVLLKRGCALEGCHSAVAMNDFKLRSGSQREFSSVALEKNYQLLRNEFMALEVPDVRRARAVAKSIPEIAGGIKHRGGAVLEGTGAASAYVCPATYDRATATPYCTVAEWAKRERAAMGDPNAGDTIDIVYVQRQAAHVAPLQDFAQYQGGSDLMRVTLTLTATGATAGTPTSILGCGATSAEADVRAPDVMNDGTTVVFAMRKNSADTLHLYRVGLDGSGCAQITNDAGVHDFDPAWSPDGQWIVYASSRRGGNTKRFDLAQSDIWRIPAGGGTPEQVTFLSNSELSPQFMRDGRITMTTEKVDIQNLTEEGFYQLAGRRINWDLTDYHPLLGQRARSLEDPADSGSEMRDSIGYPQATEIREGLDGDFLVILGPTNARAGGGDLGIFNRSIGPFERGRNDPGYLVSVAIRSAGGGAYRSPVQLPNGAVLASYAPSVDLAGATSIPFKLAIAPAGGPPSGDLGLPGESQVDATLALAYEPRALYRNRRQLVFGGSVAADAAHAVIHFPDLPMAATLLGANLRRGRHVEQLVGDTFALYDAGGAMLGSAPLADDGSVRVRVPSGTPLYIGLRNGSTEVFRMTEEHQLGPGENISLGVRREIFDNVCGGCHGSNSGREIDAAVRADALTGASESASRNSDPVSVGP